MSERKMRAAILLGSVGFAGIAYYPLEALPEFWRAMACSAASAAMLGTLLDVVGYRRA